MDQDFSTSINEGDLNGLLSKLDLEKLYSRQHYLLAELSLYEFLKQAWPIRGISNISVKRYGFENGFSSKTYLFVSLQVSFYFYRQNMSP